MKVLMFGWELPPRYAGGIGMVCYDLVNELANQDVDVTYMMPFGPEDFSSDAKVNVLIAEHVASEIQSKVSIKTVQTLFQIYQSPDEYKEAYSDYLKKSKQKYYEAASNNNLYGPDLFSEVDLFGKRSFAIIKNESIDFDIIHAHDWMTFPAAIAAADASGKPLIVHIHNTVYDRYLGNASPKERDIEMMGMQRADKVIAVSQFIKDRIVNQYGIDPNKVNVVHNAPNSQLRKPTNQRSKMNLDLGDNKVVLFTGRMTCQKGPEYFVQMAKEICTKRTDVKFVMAGTGDLFENTINLAAQFNLADKFVFTGFYNMAQARSLYAKADCYVMPSVSEPFGIVPLEAMEYGAPTIITKTSGCSEVLSHSLKVDYWDIRQMAGKVLAVLEYPVLKQELSEKGKAQVLNLNWEKPANACKQLYYELK